MFCNTCNVLGKVEKETVPIPIDDKSWIEETKESWHPPTSLPTLIPHVRQIHLNKGKLRRSCPT